MDAAAGSAPSTVAARPAARSATRRRASASPSKAASTTTSLDAARAPARSAPTSSARLEGHELGHLGRDDGLAVGARAEQPLVEERLEPRPVAVQLDRLERRASALALPAAEPQLGGVHVELEVAHEGHDLGVAPGERLVVAQALAQLRRERVEAREQRVEVLELGEELGGGLLPHPRHAGQVVGGVAAQSGEEGVARGLDPGPLEDPRLVVERVVRDAPSVVQDADVRVLHELEAVAVARDHDDVAGLVAGARGEGREHVVGLVALLGHDRDRERGEELDDDADLRLELGRRRVTPALVLLDDLVAERGARQVERDGHARGALLAHEEREHADEAVDGVGDDPVARRHLGRQREERPEREGHPVEQEERSLFWGASHPGCRPGRQVPPGSLASRNRELVEVAVPVRDALIDLGAERAWRHARRARGAGAPRRTPSR